MALTDVIAKAVGAVSQGKDPGVAVYGETGAQIDPEFIVESENVDAMSTESTLDSLLNGSKQESDQTEVATSNSGNSPNKVAKSPESTELSSNKSEAKTPEEKSTDIESVTITDDKGRRSVDINFADKDRLKKYVQMAHGARKWQVERDQAQSKLKEIEPKYTEISNNWNAMESAYKSQGVAGIVNLLEGRETAFNEFMDSQVKEREFRAKATPEQLRLLDSQKQQAELQARLDKMAAENDEFKQQMTRTKQQTEEQALTSMIHPAFTKNSFVGKLGDTQNEQLLNDLLWNRAMKRLEEYPDEIELTPDLINREFRDVAVSIQRIVKKESDKKVDQVVATKKKEATENAQHRVVNGIQGSGSASEARGLIKKGDIGSLLKNWGRYGKLFG
jgi:hypothetical protein